MKKIILKELLELGLSGGLTVPQKEFIFGLNESEILQKKTRVGVGALVEISFLGKRRKIFFLDTEMYLGKIKGVTIAPLKSEIGEAIKGLTVGITVKMQKMDITILSVE